MCLSTPQKSVISNTCTPYEKVSIDICHDYMYLSLIIMCECEKKLLHCEIVCGETNLCLSLLIVALLFNSNYASDLHLSTYRVVLRRWILICLVTLDVNRILIVGATCVETTVNIISHQLLIFFPFFPLMDKMQMNDCDLILAFM